MKKLRILLFLMIGVTIILVACKDNSKQQAAQQLELGQRYLTEGNYGKAIVAFNKAIELEPNEIQAYTGVITAYVQSGREGEATAILEKSLEQFGQADSQVGESEWGEFVKAIGQYYGVTKDYEAAIETFDRVIKRNPKSKEGYSELIDVYEKLEDYEKVIEVSEEGYKQTQEGGFQEKAEKYREELKQIQEQEEIKKLEEEQRQKDREEIEKLEEEQKQKEREEIEKLATEQGQEVIYVKNTKELLQIFEECKSNVYIVLERKDYGTYGFSLQNCENVTIHGTDGTRMIASSENKYVLTLQNCKNITLKKLVLGHRVLLNECPAGVISSLDSKVNFLECDIFGCGINGISGVGSIITAIDTTIRDCAEDIMSISGGDVIFQDCNFLRNGYRWPSENAIWIGTGYETTAVFSNCIFSENKNQNCINDGADCTFDNCTFFGNGWGGDNVSSAPEVP